MVYNTKYHISRDAVVVCLIFAAVGLKNIYTTQGADGVFGIGFLGGGVILGCIAGVNFYYYGSRRLDIQVQQQIAVETLSKLAAQKRGGK